MVFFKDFAPSQVCFAMAPSWAWQHFKRVKDDVHQHHVVCQVCPKDKRQSNGKQYPNTQHYTYDQSFEVAAWHDEIWAQGFHESNVFLLSQFSTWGTCFSVECSFSHQSLLRSDLRALLDDSSIHALMSVWMNLSVCFLPSPLKRMWHSVTFPWDRASRMINAMH